MFEEKQHMQINIHSNPTQLEALNKLPLFTAYNWFPTLIH